MTHQKKSDIFLGVFNVICILFLLWLLIGGLVKKWQLDRNVKYTNAIVIDHFYSIRQSNYFSYTFYVDTILYKGGGFYYPDSDTFGVGDSIEIVYSSVNPSNNEPKRQYRRHSIIKP